MCAVAVADELTRKRITTNLHFRLFLQQQFHVIVPLVG